MRTVDTMSPDAIRRMMYPAVQNATLGSAPLWPEKYSQPTGESAFAYLTDCCYTFDETDGSVALVPPKEYIEALAHEWQNAFNIRQPLIIEKSRRVIVSWICRGLELRQMGIQRGESIVVDQIYENAAKHLWRCYHIYTTLRERRPDFRLRECVAHGSIQMKMVDNLKLPNGSIMTQGHQEAGVQQGQGKTMIVLEEVAKYKTPSVFWGQGTIMTMGKPGSKGGWTCGIANASPNPDWATIKSAQSARELLGLE